MTAAAPTTASTAAPSTAWQALSPDEALRQQGVDIEHGLSTAEADARRAKVGSNASAEAKKASKVLKIRVHSKPVAVAAPAAA